MGFASGERRRTSWNSFRGPHIFNTMGQFLRTTRLGSYVDPILRSIANLYMEDVRNRLKHPRSKSLRYGICERHIYMIEIVNTEKMVVYETSGGWEEGGRGSIWV